jgi:GntR family transcriptional regulator
MTERVSRSQRLYEDLGNVIALTDPGMRLPSEPTLARRLGVSRATLREAMRAFEAQGLIRRKQGVGTFVVRPSRVIESGLEVLESIETVANRMGLVVAFGDLKLQHRPPNKEEIKALAIEPGVNVEHVSRVILVEERPVAFLVDVLPEGILSTHDLETSFSGSVLDLLLRQGEPLLYNSCCEISSVAASSEVARALNIQRGDALLRFISMLYAVDGKVVAYSFSYFLPGYFRFHVVRALNTPY